MHCNRCRVHVSLCNIQLHPVQLAENDGYPKANGPLLALRMELHTVILSRIAGCSPELAD